MKQFVLEAPFEDYMIEFLGFFGTTFYIIFRNTFQGNHYVQDSKKTNKQHLVTSLINSIVITIVLTILQIINGEEYIFGLEIFIVWIVSFSGSFGLLKLIDYINNKRIQQINNRLDKLE
ncbi:DUF6773 family protein [Bacillus tuaregi]|uniref:DUF6773 family protein n=1 Tax=Bacillus tuaregi TaxID=1816695 RepID=UPI0028FC7E50|nr:DUF6773 family protein [Bacillus tuaregi]